MKILLTVHQFLPDFSAGTETLTFETAKALVARGHEISVFAGFPARSAVEEARRFDRYMHEGIPVERFRHNYAPMGTEPNIAALEYNNRFFAAYFRTYLIRTRPDVVHFFHLQRLSASAIDVCEELGLPMVLTPTDFWLVCPTNQLLLPNHALCLGPDPDGANCVRHVVARTQSPLARRCLDMMPGWLLSAMIRGLNRGFFPRQKQASYVRALSSRHRFMKSRMNRVQRVTVPTRLMADMLRKNGLSTPKVTFLPFGINTEGLSRKAPASSRARLRIGFIGTLYEHKGAHILLEAVRSLATEIPIELRIYGNHNEFPKYIARLRRIAADDPPVEFCGTFPHGRSGEILSSLDVLVVPSLWYENAPLVINSDQACGCPVIASNLGGTSEVVVHEENGLLFEAGNVNELAQAIRRLACDRTLLRKLEEKARKPKSIGEYATELESVYNEILAERRASA